MTMGRKLIQIARGKLRAAVRKLAKKYFDLKRLRPDAEPATRPGLLMDVKRFEKASLANSITSLSASIPRTVRKSPLEPLHGLPSNCDSSIAA